MFDPLPDRYRIDSIFDQSWCGLGDSIWTERLKPEGWVVVTADKGRKKRGEKLPILCFRLGITLVRLTSTVHHLKMAEKAPFLIAAVQEWNAQTFAEAGRCYSLHMQDNRRPKLTDRTERTRKRISPDG